MVDSVSFNVGISGVSRLAEPEKSSVLPRTKSEMKPSGKKVVNHFHKTVCSPHNLLSIEFKFATKLSGPEFFSSPDEHYLFTKQAIDSMSSYINKLPKNSLEAKKMQLALNVIETAKADSEYLMMCRNVLIAS